MLHLTTVQIGLLVPLQPYRFQGSDSLNGAILKGPKLFPEYHVKGAPRSNITDVTDY